MASVFTQKKYKTLIDNHRETQNGFQISFCGRFNTGKSTLINRLLHRDILPTQFTTATAVITRIEYGLAEEAFVVTNGKQEKVSFDNAREVILYDGQQNLKAKAQKTVIFKLPLPLLINGVTLVDTPGIDDHTVLEEVSLAEARKSTLCVVVFQAQQFNGLSEKNFCEAVNAEIGGNLVFVANKCDIINSPEQFQLLTRQCKEVLDKFGNDFVGHGKTFFTVCDRTVDLDGLDTWLNNIIQPNNAQTVQNIANRQRVTNLYATLGRLLEEDISVVENNLTELRKEKENALADTDRNDKSDLLNIRTAMTEFKRTALESLRSTYEIEPALEALKKETGWAANYKENSKNAIASILKSRIKKVRADFNRQFAAHNLSFPDININGWLSGITFPNADITAGSSGAGVGLAVGVAAGALLTFLSFGMAAPVAIAAGKSAQRMAEKPSVDNSTQTTKSFIEREVFPKITSEIDRIFTDMNTSANAMGSAQTVSNNYDRMIKNATNKLGELRYGRTQVQQRALSLSI